MKTLTVQEASQNLGLWLRCAMGGEQIAIHEGSCTVLLQPLSSAQGSSESNQLSAREALRLMQNESSLTPEQAEKYMLEVWEERLAAESRQPA